MGCFPYSSRGCNLGFSGIVFYLAESSLAQALVWFYSSDDFVPGINQTSPGFLPNSKFVLHRKPWLFCELLGDRVRCFVTLRPILYAELKMFLGLSA